MSTSVIASSVVALLVALFNLVLAAHWVQPGPMSRFRVAFAAAPAGLFVFAVGWFLRAVNPAIVLEAHALGGIGVMLSMGGFAVDAAGALPGPSRGRLALVAVGGALAAAVAGYASVVLGLASTTWVPRAVAAALVLAVLVMRLKARGVGTESARKLSRDIVAVTVLSSVAAALLYGFAVAQGHWRLDPVLWLALVAECLILVYVMDRRVEVHLLLSQGLTWVIFALAVAFAAAFLFAQLGHAVNLVQVALTMVLALLAALFFMALGDRVTFRIGALLFPEESRLAARLAVTRGEAALLRRRLERAERLAIAGELAASVAHGVKNPLAALRGYAQLLAGCADQVGEPARPQFEKALRIMQEESDRIDAQIAELLSVARNARPGPTTSGRFDLDRVVADAVAVARDEPQTPELEVRLGPLPGEVVGDEDEIRGAVANLLDNAIEASEAGRRPIEVRTTLEGGRAVVEIRDEGVGLAPEDVERLFRPFHTTKSKGTGLGLVIARSAAEAAGGKVTLAPREDRKGAVARIELALAGAKAKEER